MVRLKFKKENEGLFIMDTTLDKEVKVIIDYIVKVQNGRLKIERLCYEIGELGKHGISLPPNMQGLTEEQVVELKLKDEWQAKCIPSGGVTQRKDDIGRRSGQAPMENMQTVLNDTVEEAKQKVSKKHFENNKVVTNEDVKDCLAILKGAVTIVYPMGLPPHDPIQAEFDDNEDLAGTQMAKEVLDLNNLSLWYCGKEMTPTEKPLSHFMGKNEKTTVIIKLTKKGHGCPAREPVVNEQEQKLMMAHAYRRQEELKKLAENEDTDYLGSAWADPSSLKQQLHGVSNIKWR
ncbi:cilia- and flagella-associated protein 298-A-like [Symsagittifera roscoffensis]|uniref:cilia- and flagella-associated protein 298-A-like n=1 Tax=Symsagittifera roscoffensis TaxID=84072 RepID=UPI00307C5C20